MMVDYTWNEVQFGINNQDFLPLQVTGLRRQQKKQRNMAK